MFLAQSIGFLVLMAVQTPAGLWLFAVLTGLCGAGGMFIALMLLADIYGLRALGTLWGIAILFHSIGGVIAPSMVSLAILFTGSHLLPTAACALMLGFASIIGIRAQREEVLATVPSRLLRLGVGEWTAAPTATSTRDCVGAQCTVSPVLSKSVAVLPTSRSAVGYWHDNTSHVVHPDISFILDLTEGYRPYFLEYERRAVTPRRVRARLKNYPRYFASGWADQDHAGQLPLVLFVFETHDAEESFLRAAGAHRLPICTSNLEMINELGVLREVWRWPPPNSSDRLPLHRLGEGYKNVPSRSRHFL